MKDLKTLPASDNLPPSGATRRRLLASAAALPAVLGAGQAAATNGGAHHRGHHGHHGHHGQHGSHAHPSRPQHPDLPVQPVPSAEEEERLLDALYQAAVSRGERLVVYAGGDTATQQDFARNAFQERFPNIDINIVVDYSKIHDVRLDNQFATDTVIPDVVQLQTLQDFERWKKQGRLLHYRPSAFGALHPDFRDPDGAWVAHTVIGFSYMYNPSAVTGPASPQQLADGQWRGQIASSYPQDDDAVLFLYKLYAEAYGWDWVRRMAQQEIQFARGTNTPGEAVNSGQKNIGIGGSGSTLSASAQMRWVRPEGHPFMAWGQRAAILQRARNLNAARLYIEWSLSRARQMQSFNGWSVRTDVRPNQDLEPIWTIKEAHLREFPAFMRNRAEVERWRQTFVMYFGDVQGEPSPGVLGLHPGI